jgi:hypothetical protein
VWPGSTRGQHFLCITIDSNAGVIPNAVTGCGAPGFANHPAAFNGVLLVRDVISAHLFNINAWSLNADLVNQCPHLWSPVTYSKRMCQNSLYAVRATLCLLCTHSMSLQDYTNNAPGQALCQFQIVSAGAVPFTTISKVAVNDPVLDIWISGGLLLTGQPLLVSTWHHANSIANPPACCTGASGTALCHVNCDPSGGAAACADSVVNIGVQRIDAAAFSAGLAAGAADDGFVFNALTQDHSKIGYSWTAGAGHWVRTTNIAFLHLGRFSVGVRQRPQSSRRQFDRHGQQRSQWRNHLLSRPARPGHP